MLVGPAAAVLWAAAVAITSVYALEEQEQQQRDEFPFLSPAEQEQRQHEQQRKSCPGYLMYSQDDKHEPYSPGKWRLPYQRPTPECRTWTSPEVEEAIRSMKTVIKDPDLYRLFENTYPNTLDTTIRWHGFANGTDEELTFITTGDIEAMWLRDSANQLRSYLPILRANSSTKSLASLFRGAINMHARYVLASPHCNAFQPPPESGIAGTPNNWAASDRVTPRPDHSLVFECKWEPDSAAAFLQLSADYHERTQDAAFFAKYQWSKAVSALLDWLEKNQEGAATYNSEGSTREAPYKFSRTSDSASETLANLGAGEPVAGGTGLVRGAFRPSDDASIFGFLIPANMMLASNLARCAAIADSSAGTADGGLRNATLAARLRAMATKIRGGVEGFGKAVHRRYGEIYAYEVDGFGSVNLMDDANTPSLLSAPLLGYLDRTDPIYQNTRRFVLSTDNRYYMHGTVLNATGGPHVGPGNAWPMGAITMIMTSDSDLEIRGALMQLLSSTNGLGLMHETVNSHRAATWTRQWFSWANGLFGQMILDLKERKPDLLAQSYQPPEGWKPPPDPWA